MTVWKFPLTTTDEQVIEIPEVNRPLTVQVQGGRPCLWALVDPTSVRCKVTIRIFGTGHEGVRNSMDYIGTYQVHEGLVFHVFIAGWMAHGIE